MHQHETRHQWDHISSMHPLLLVIPVSSSELSISFIYSSTNYCRCRDQKTLRSARLSEGFASDGSWTWRKGCKSWYIHLGLSKNVGQTWEASNSSCDFSKEQLKMLPNSSCNVGVYFISEQIHLRKHIWNRSIWHLCIVANWKADVIHSFEKSRPTQSGFVNRVHHLIHGLKLSFTMFHHIPPLKMLGTSR